MGKDTLEKLEAYKLRHHLTDLALAQRLGVYYNYIYRWRKAGRIIGMYDRHVAEFLKNEQDNEEI